MAKNPYHYHFPMADMRVDVHSTADGQLMVVVSTISSDYPVCESNVPTLGGARRMARLFAEGIRKGVIPHPDEHIA